MTTQRYREERPIILRLVLVGLVAALGFNWPSRRDLDTLARATERWMNDRIAAWDSQTTADSGSYVFEIAPAPLAEPIALNSRSEPEERVEPTQGPSASTSDELFAEVQTETVAEFSQDEFRRLGASRPIAWEELPSPALPTALAVEPPVAPEVLVSDDSTGFTDSFDEPSRDAIAEFAAAEVEGLEPLVAVDAAFDGVLDEMVDGFDQDTSLLVKQAEVGRDTPLERGGEFKAGDVYALNSHSDKTPPAESVGEAKKGKENRLTNAVRLTREAVVAWASLLHGPAVVIVAP